ncbi:MAG: antiterminator LoaP [Erysipelotrichaceae bacterium]|nr:antiterminator LoaP [Erysipelotrichaceae bacterium]
MEFWQVVHVLGGYESKICDFINKDSRNIAFIPKKKKVFRKRGINKVDESVLFANYVFVKTKMEFFEFIEYVQLFLVGIEGFIKLLKHDNVGTESLLPEEIDFLRRFLNENFIVDESFGILEGDSVIVLDGPLVGCESLITKIDRHKRLAWIQFSMFGEIRTISVSLEIISKK